MKRSSIHRIIGACIAGALGFTAAAQVSAFPGAEDCEASGSCEDAVAAFCANPALDNYGFIGDCEADILNDEVTYDPPWYPYPSPSNWSTAESVDLE